MTQVSSFRSLAGYPPSVDTKDGLGTGYFNNDDHDAAYNLKLPRIFDQPINTLHRYKHK